MIGNSNDIMCIVKYFKKMFVGFNGLIMEEEGVIIGFILKEGEVVCFKKEINFVKMFKINDWLVLLENGMKVMFVELLVEVVEDFIFIFNSGEINWEVFNKFMMVYFSQIVVFVIQVVWIIVVEQVFVEGGQSLLVFFECEV